VDGGQHRNSFFEPGWIQGADITSLADHVKIKPAKNIGWFQWREHFQEFDRLNKSKPCSVYVD
jgi:hypothetical protein